MSETPSRAERVEAFRVQVEGCRGAGSELSARMMERCTDDLEAGGALAQRLEGWRGHPVLDALCQRVLGAVQGEALAGRAPAPTRRSSGCAARRPASSTWRCA